MDCLTCLFLLMVQSCFSTINQKQILPHYSIATCSTVLFSTSNQWRSSYYGSHWNIRHRTKGMEMPHPLVVIVLALSNIIFPLINFESSFMHMIDVKLVVYASDELFQ